MPRAAQAAPAAEEAAPPLVRARAARKPQPVRNVAPVRSRRNDVDADEVGQQPARAMKSRGSAREALDAPHAVQTSRHLTKEKADALKFNEEVLTIVVHDTTNPTDEQIVEVFNDGRRQNFIRGKEQQVKRKFVEILARCRKTTRSNQKVKDANGDDTYIYPGHTALRYPFAVLHDPSPEKGKAWLKKILEEEG